MGVSNIGSLISQEKGKSLFACCNRCSTYEEGSFVCKRRRGRVYFSLFQMDHSVFAPKTCILSVNIHCPSCERKVRKVLQKINGVCSVAIDGEEGKVTVSGVVDPHTLVIALGKVGKRAELLREHCQPMKNQHQCMKVSQPSSSQANDPHMAAQMAQLHQLSKVKRVKQVEVVKRVRMMFSGHGDDLSQKDDTQCARIAMDDVHGTQMHHGSGPSGAATPCCSGCHVHATTQQDCHEVDVCCCVGPSTANSVRSEHCNGCGPPRSCRCGGSTTACNHFAPRIPPESPPVANPYPSIFSDDNPSGCMVM